VGKCHTTADNAAILVDKCKFSNLLYLILSKGVKTQMLVLLVGLQNWNDVTPLPRNAKKP